MDDSVLVEPPEGGSAGEARYGFALSPSRIQSLLALEIEETGRASDDISGTRRTKIVPNSIKTPVLIVGAGPVGLALAVELGWRSVPCVLIEQSDGTSERPDGNKVNTRTMEFFFCRRWGITDDVMSCPFPDDWPMDVVLATKIGAYELGRIPRASRKDQKPGPDSPMNLQVCSQLWFDPILRKKAERLPSVRLLYRHRLESFSTDPDGVTARVRDLDADQEIMIRCSDTGRLRRRRKSRAPNRRY